MPTPEEIDELYFTNEEFDLLDSAFKIPKLHNELAGYRAEPIIDFHKKRINLQLINPDNMTQCNEVHIDIPTLTAALKMYYDKIGDPTFDGNVINTA